VESFRRESMKVLRNASLSLQKLAAEEASPSRPAMPVLPEDAANQEDGAQQCPAQPGPLFQNIDNLMRTQSDEFRHILMEGDMQGYIERWIQLLNDLEVKLVAETSGASARGLTQQSRTELINSLANSLMPGSSERMSSAPSTNKHTFLTNGHSSKHALQHVPQVASARNHLLQLAANLEQSPTWPDCYDSAQDVVDARKDNYADAFQRLQRMNARVENCLDVVSHSEKPPARPARRKDPAGDIGRMEVLPEGLPDEQYLVDRAKDEECSVHPPSVSPLPQRAGMTRIRSSSANTSSRVHVCKEVSQRMSVSLSSMDDNVGARTIMRLNNVNRPATTGKKKGGRSKSNGRGPEDTGGMPD